MIRKLLGKRPLRCWPIKQIDDDVLHLCEVSTLETTLKRQAAEKALARGNYHGGVRLGATGLVLNSRLFEALVPHDELILDKTAQTARWRGRTWQVSRVPQRCASWEGRLITQPSRLDTQPGLVSSEDVSAIRANAEELACAPTTVEFRPADALEVASVDIQEAVAKSRRRRQRELEDERARQLS